MPYGKPNNDQSNLFGENEDWKEEWKGMPEYVQENLLPAFSVRVNFATIEDLREFAELVNQHLTTKTQSIWFPEQDRAKLSDKRYVDED